MAAAIEAALRADPARAYPESVEELAPALLPTVPLDRFSDKPLVYERRGDGYLLRSLGLDMRDDGEYVDFDFYGGWLVKGEWQQEPVSDTFGADDILARMPMPMLPFRKP